MRKIIKLPDVTLIAISSIEIPKTIEVLQKCSSMMEFGETKFISNVKPSNLPENIIFEECPEIKNIDDYNYYMFREFGKHITTSHCLLVQYHAWILDPDLFDQNWLQYDYGGSPWAIRDNAYMSNDGTRSRVGNGGFSLRSSRLMNLSKKYDLPLREEQGWKNEDGQICCYYKKEFLNWGIKYMPLEDAAKFAYETSVPENKGIANFFGFHRNLPVKESIFNKVIYF
jgi:hypothetical protein